MTAPDRPLASPPLSGRCNTDTDAVVRVPNAHRENNNCNICIVQSGHGLYFVYLRCRCLRLFAVFYRRFVFVFSTRSNSGELHGLADPVTATTTETTTTTTAPTTTITTTTNTRPFNRRRPASSL